MLIKRRTPRTLAGQPPDELTSSDGRGWPRWRLAAIPRPALIGVVMGLLALVALAIPVVGTLLTLRAGTDDLKAAARQLEGQGLSLTVKNTASADAGFLQAEQQFSKAESGLRTDPAFRLLSLLPFTRRQVSATIALDRSALHVARAGRQGVTLANALIGEKILGPDHPKSNPGQEALTLLAAVTPRLDPVIGELSAAQAERDRVPGGWLLWPIRSGVSSFDSQFGGVVAGLKELPVIQPGLQALLGANGPELYMVLQQDPAELRPTGGFIGSIGFVGFDHGQMRPYESHPVESLDINAKGKLVLGTVGSPNFVEPPAPFKLLIPVDSWELRDANWSPDFPTSARQAQRFFTLEQPQHLQVQGILSVDPYLVADMLTVTGPIYVPETKETITSENFFKDTLVGVHAGLGKSILSYAAKAIMDRFSKLGPSGLLHMLSVVKRACDGRSLQAYFDDPAAQAMVDHFHCGGQLLPLKSDGAFVVDTNLGASKDDYWVTRHFDLALQVRPDGSVRHTLSLHYDGSQLVPNGDLTLAYRDWLRVYLPAGARVVQVEGIGGHGLGPRTVTDLGRVVVQGWMEFGFQGFADVTLVYDVKPAAGVDGRHDLEFFWQKQAGRLHDPITVSLQLPSGWSLTQARVDGAPVTGTTIRSDLALDRQFSFSYQPPP